MDYASQRRSIRLKGYDYTSTGAYFVTICAHARQPLFENSGLKEILRGTWDAQQGRFPSISLDALVVMPNHVHFIVWLNAVGAPLAGARAPRPGRAGASPAPTLGQVVGAFKSIVATKWRKRNTPRHSARVWQRNYYERVIRDEEELNRVREYILLNPLKWEFDRENPLRVTNSQYQEEWDWLEAGEHGMGRPVSTQAYNGETT
jgi:putative transposase